MDFDTMTDAQIIETIGNNIEKMRISQNITAEDMALKGGYNSQSYSNFINKNTNIKIETLIQMFRGIGQLSTLQKAFEYKESFSPYGNTNSKAKRVRKSKEITKIVWGDDE